MQIVCMMTLFGLSMQNLYDTKHILHAHVWDEKIDLLYMHAYLHKEVLHNINILSLLHVVPLTYTNS